MVGVEFRGYRSPRTNHQTRSYMQLNNDRRKAMTRSIAVVFVLALASSAQALSPAPLHQPHEMVIKVREACGAGMHRVNGVCVTTHARRAARRCAAGVTC